MARTVVFHLADPDKHQTWCRLSIFGGIHYVEATLRPDYAFAAAHHKWCDECMRRIPAA